MEKEGTRLKVANIVVSSTLAGLPDVHIKQEQPKHNHFFYTAHFSFPHRDYSCKTFLYPKGAVNCVGIKSYEDIAPCSAKAFQYISQKYPGNNIRVLSSAIHNIVASAQLECNIKLEALMLIGKYMVKFKPEKFPGAYLREGDPDFDEDVTVFKLFRTGKYYTVGGDDHRQIVLNGNRFPGYVSSVVFNHVCCLRRPPFPKLAHILPIINNSILRSLFGWWTFQELEEGYLRLVSSEFVFPGTWDIRQNDSYLFRLYLHRDGYITEDAHLVSPPLPHTHADAGRSAQQGVADATLKRKKQKERNKAQEDEGVAVEDEEEVEVEKDPAVGNGAYKPERECTAITRGAFRMVWWAHLLNSDRNIAASIGAATFMREGRHFFIKSRRGVLMYGDGDIYIPPALSPTPADGDEIAKRIWKVCGFTEFNYTPPPDTTRWLNLKKIAAAMNKQRCICRFEPLANVIRFKQGGYVDVRGGLWTHEAYPVQKRFVWNIAKLSKKKKGGEKRKTGAEDEDGGEVPQTLEPPKEKRKIAKYAP